MKGGSVMKLMKRMKWITTIITEMKYHIILLALLIVVSSYLSIVPIQFIQRIIDLALNSANIQSIVITALIYIVLQISAASLKGYVTYLIEKIQAKIGRQSKDIAFEKLLNIDASVYANTRTTDFTNRIRDDTDYISDNVIRITATIFQSIITFIIGLYFMITINLLLVLIILPFGLITSIISSMTSQRIEQLANNNKNAFLSLIKIYNEGIQGILPIKINNANDEYKTKSTLSSQQLEIIKIKQGKLNGIRLFLMSSLFMTTIGVIMLVLSLLTREKQISVGALTAIMMYNHMLVDPLIAIFEEKKNITQLNISIERVDKIFNYQEQKLIFQNINIEKIVVKNLSFNYENEKILTDINLEIYNKQKVAIIGETGCGKSTLANIICGLYLPENGYIQYITKDQEAVNGYPEFGYMIQDGYIFDESLFENIKLANKNLEIELFNSIINICCLDNVYKRYQDKKLGENGSFLSSGEKKRVQIARTIADLSKNIYIFDELSSNLDDNIGSLIFNNVLNLLNDKICIFIEHDIVQANKCDRVIVMDKGRIINENNK